MLPTELESDALVAVDKLDKIGLDGVEKELRSRGIDHTASTALLDLMASAPEDTDAALCWLEDKLACSENGAQAVAELKNVVTLTQTGPARRSHPYRPIPGARPELLHRAHLRNRIPHPERLRRRRRTLRRPDRHVQQTARSPPAGFSLGLERILLIMEERNLFPQKLAGQPQILVTNFDRETLAANVELARSLRQAGPAR